MQWPISLCVRMSSWEFLKKEEKRKEEKGTGAAEFAVSSQTSATEHEIPPGEAIRVGKVPQAEDFGHQLGELIVSHSASRHRK